MLKKAVTLFSILVAFFAIFLVAYGMRTACPDVATYVFCAQVER